MVTERTACRSGSVRECVADAVPRRSGTAGLVGGPVALLALALLGACGPTEATGEAKGAGAKTCQREAAAALVGQAAGSDADILRQTGAAIVRRIAPGDMVTQDFRTDRVTVTVDPAGRVTAASCG
ncbi:I78 family peptidase inhibitor [Terrihabitans sp. B22-R8]|uniref:I78 family peptidase inhibitor n=1 Tax=Terrihabitans sp. B22-R8 TaxID=3425128 RepID=UPI00403CE9C1